MTLALAVTALAGPGGCVVHSQGITVPTLIASTPPGSPLLNNVNAWYAPTGSSFTLAPVGPSTCLDFTCNHVLPDFNIQWFAGSTTFGSPLSHYDEPGPDAGPIPGAATYGVVYMRYGPDGTADGPIHQALFHLQICP